MNTRNGLILLTLILGLGAFAYHKGWVKIPTLHASKEEPMATVAQLEKFRAEIKSELENKNKISELETEISNLKSQLSERATAASEADSANTLTQDKLAEVQDQLNDLSAKIDKMGSCCSDTSCMDNCMAGCKAKCEQKKAAPLPVKKVVRKPRPTPCRETSAYKACVSEREKTWDAHCGTPAKELINTKIVDKYTKKGGTKTEMQTAIIKIDKAPRHAMCMTPRNFYGAQCDRIVCGR